MRIYTKDFRNIFLLLSLSVFSLELQASGENKNKTAKETARTSVAENTTATDWKKVYSTNSYLTFEQGLHGLTNGIYTSQSGTPGNSGNIMLRGITTANLNASPYVVIDGIVIRMARNISPFATGYLTSNTAFVNPLDIAGIEILQSGYNSVLYGGKASNGILNLTTNKGSAGRTSIELMLRVGLQQADYKHENMMNGEDFRAYLYGYMYDMGTSVVDL